MEPGKGPPGFCQSSIAGGAAGAVVVIPTPNGDGAAPLVVRVAGETVQVDSDGAPVQEKETVPVKPVVGAMLKL